VATSTFVADANNALAATRAETAQAAQTGVEDFILHPKPPESMTVEETRAYIRTQKLLPADQLASLPDEAILQAYKMSYQDALRIQAARAQAAGGTAPAVSGATSSPALVPTSPSASTPAPQPTL
jgi:hypothetical protein